MQNNPTAWISDNLAPLEEIRTEALITLTLKLPANLKEGVVEFLDKWDYPYTTTLDSSGDFYLLTVDYTS